MFKKKGEWEKIYLAINNLSSPALSALLCLIKSEPFVINRLTLSLHIVQNSAKSEVKSLLLKSLDKTNQNNSAKWHISFKLRCCSHWKFTIVQMKLPCTDSQDPKAGILLGI